VNHPKNVVKIANRRESWMRASGNANGPERPTDWNAVNWRKVQRSVRNLRQRIFRATQAGDWRKVRSLQKLMLRSRSNILLSVRQVTQVHSRKRRRHC
jgi:RNA-directed DNA polymerase